MFLWNEFENFGPICYKLTEIEPSSSVDGPQDLTETADGLLNGLSGQKNRRRKMIANEVFDMQAPVGMISEQIGTTTLELER